MDATQERKCGDSTDKFILLRHLTTALSEYFAIASDVMARVDPGTYAKFEKQLVEAKKLVDEVERLEMSAKTLADYLTAFSELDTLTIMLFSMASILNTPYYETKMTLTKSVGFQMDIKDRMKRIVSLIQEYKSVASRCELHDIARVITNLQLDDVASRESALSTVLTATAPSKLIVEVIRAIVKADPGLRPKLSPVIERLKNSVLGGDSVVSGKVTPATIETWFTYQLDMVPMSLYMSPNELCAELNPSYRYDTTATPHTNILNAVGESTSLMFIQRAGDREVDYCVRGLIDDDYIHSHSLHTNQSAGLNKRVVKRFSSIRDVLGDQAIATSAPMFTPRGPECVVVVQLGDKYRVMGAYVDGEVRIRMPSEYVAKLLEPLGARPINYHDIQSSYILSIGEVVDYRSIIRWYEEQRLAASPQTENFKVELVKKLVESVVIDPHLHNSLKTFTELCKNSFQQGLIAETIRFLNERNLFGREKRSTFTVRMSNLIAAYQSTLERVIETKLSASQFTERGDVVRHLKGLYSDVTRATIEALDVPPSKFQQLGITLKEHFLKTHGDLAM